MKESRFTFGQNHMTSFPLPNGGRLADYWVTVILPHDYPQSPREVFMEEFTGQYCPTKTQFAFEYSGADAIDPFWFPGGELHRITRS